MAGFQLSINGRFWVSTEESDRRLQFPNKIASLSTAAHTKVCTIQKSRVDAYGGRFGAMECRSSRLSYRLCKRNTEPQTLGATIAFGLMESLSHDASVRFDYASRRDIVGIGC